MRAAPCFSARRFGAIVNRDLTFADFWADPDRIQYFRKKSAKCAEVLVPDRIDPQYFRCAYGLEKRVLLCDDAAILWLWSAGCRGTAFRIRFSFTVRDIVAKEDVRNLGGSMQQNIQANAPIPPPAISLSALLHTVAAKIN